MTAAAAMMFAVNRNRFSASVTSISVGASGRQPSLTTTSTTAIPNGGQSPYTYSWSMVDTDDLGRWRIDSPSSPTTTFTCSDLESGVTSTAKFVCTVNDAIGDPPAAAPPVTAFAQNTL